MSVNKNVKEESIPRQILAKIREFTGGGFIIVYPNHDKSPIYKEVFENDIEKIGLRKFALDTLETISSEIFIQNDNE